DPLMATVARRCEGVGAGARRSQVLHAGPPITWEKMCGAMKGAFCIRKNTSARIIILLPEAIRHTQAFHAL
ncbi:hypothetical protein J4Y29_19920, partial [Escherichia coli]